MKLLYLTEEAISFSKPLVRGGAIHVRNVVEGLRDRGHKVYLVDWNKSPERPFQESITPRTRFFDGAIRTFLRALAVARNQNVDLIMSKTRKTYVAGIAAARLLNIPHLVHVGTTLSTPGRASIIDWVDAMSFDFRLWLSHDGYLVVCDYIRDQLRERGVPEKRIYNVKNAVDSDRFKPGEGTPPKPLSNLSKRTLIGFIGGIHEYKGVYDLSSAIKRLSDDVTIVIAGSGPERDSLERRLGDRAMFLGAVPYDRIPGVFDAIDVLALPSYTEGLPRVLLEAAAMEVPVVATNVGGVPEVVDDGVTGLLCPPRDSNKFANALKQLLQDPDRRRSMGKAARKRVVEGYSWNRMYARYEDALDQLS